MKKNLFTLLATFMGLTSFGQSTGQITSILSDDITQGEQIIEAYFTPMAR